MNYETEVLNKLIDKYENRVEGSNRRVRIVLDKNEIPVPDIENEKYFDFRKSMISLKKREYIDFDWIRKEYILKSVWLNLDKADEIYTFLNREKTVAIASNVAAMIDEALQQIKNDWIYDYLLQCRNSLTEKNKPIGIWKKDMVFLNDFIGALKGIDALNGKSVSMRSFSVKIYGNSKTFERNIKQHIIPVIKKSEPELKGIDELSERAVLAQVGIVMMSEIFEFCGNIQINYNNGTVDYSPITKGACISSDCISEIRSIDISDTSKIIFIENKTNYTEYCLNSKSDNELVIYHGGFYSPQKGDFFHLLCGGTDIPCFFWADIDYGGFKMFMRLKNNIIYNLLPLNMDIDCYNRYVDYGLKRGDDYIRLLKELINDPDYSIFYDVIDAIIKSKVTVEQENFL